MALHSRHAAYALSKTASSPLFLLPPIPSFLDLSRHQGMDTAEGLAWFALHSLHTSARMDVRDEAREEVCS